MHLAAGLSVGMTGLAAGYAIGIVGDMASLTFLSCVVLVTTNPCEGSSILHAAITNIRRHGLNLDFWRGTRALRVCDPLTYFLRQSLILETG